MNLPHRNIFTSIQVGFCHRMNSGQIRLCVQIREGKFLVFRAFLILELRLGHCEPILYQFQIIFALGNPDRKINRIPPYRYQQKSGQSSNDIDRCNLEGLSEWLNVVQTLTLWERQERLLLTLCIPDCLELFEHHKLFVFITAPNLTNC